MTERASRTGRLHDWAPIAAMLALAAVVGAACATHAQADSTSGASDASPHVVTIQNMQFDPAELVVKRGSRVVWINKDLVAHTATARSFDSGTIEVDASWSHVASEPGEYAYLCALHPTMKGRLIVR